MTNQELIDKALQELGVLGEGESGTTNASTDLMEMLNQMMALWAVEDKDLQYPPQDTLGDTSPVPSWAVMPVITGLAVRAAPIFQLAVTPELAIKAANGEKTVARTLINTNLEGADMSHLPQGDSFNWDITTDS